jgi:broad specificity phosphatase PhoE
MSTEHPDIERLRRVSKRLLRDARAGKPEALRMLVRTDREPRLADAQYAVAKKVGFASWPALVATAGTYGFLPSSDELRTRLILVRAGRRITDGLIGQHRAPGLSPLGRQQATAVAQRLASGEFGAIDVVLSSRRPPSIETAAIIASAVGIDAEPPTCDLCEMHPGDAEGLTPDEMFDQFGPNYEFVPGAESAADVEARVAPALFRLVDGYRGRGIVAVTEPSVVACSMTAFGGMPRNAARPNYGSITVWSCLAEGDPRRVGQWELDRFNDRPSST